MIFLNAHPWAEQAVRSLVSLGVPAQLASTSEGDLVLEVHSGHVSARWRLVPLEARSLTALTARLLSEGIDTGPLPSALLLDYVSPALAERLQSSGWDYLDTRGNSRLEAPGVWVLVRRGRRREPLSEPPARVEEGTGALTPSGVRVVFCLLARSDVASWPVREIAAAANVSVGSAHAVLRELDAAGYLEGPTGRDRRLRKYGDLARKWVVAFEERLVPKLGGRRYDSMLEVDELLRRWGDDEDITLSGEAVAQGVRHPHVVIGYIDGTGSSVVRSGRLRRVERGKVLLRHRFWNDEVLGVGTRTPDILVAVDLLTAPDERLQEAGREMLATLEEEHV